jgi:hypothetical protein
VFRKQKKIGEKCTNLSSEFGVLILGEIFLPNAVLRQLFSWQNKFGEIDPDVNFNNTLCAKGQTSFCMNNFSSLFMARAFCKVNFFQVMDLGKLKSTI